MYKYKTSILKMDMKKMNYSEIASLIKNINQDNRNKYTTYFGVMIEKENINPNDLLIASLNYPYLTALSLKFGADPNGYHRLQNEQLANILYITVNHIQDANLFYQTFLILLKFGLNLNLNIFVDKLKLQDFNNIRHFNFKVPDTQNYTNAEYLKINNFRILNSDDVRSTFLFSM